MRPKVREKQLLVTGSVAKDPQRSICHDLRDVDKPINSSYFTLFENSFLLQSFKWTKGEKSDKVQPNEKIHEPPWDGPQKTSCCRALTTTFNFMRPYLETQMSAFADIPANIFPNHPAISYPDLRLSSTQQN